MTSFDLVRPCPKCPFRTDCLEGWLRKDRAIEIVESLTLHDQGFPCHETTNLDDDGDYVPGGQREQHCAGALIMLENSGQGAGQLARIAERLGKFDPDKLDLEFPVFRSFDDFIIHHAGDEWVEVEACSKVDEECLAPAGFAVGGGVMTNHDIDPDDMTSCEQCGEPLCKNCTCWCDDNEE